MTQLRIAYENSKSNSTQNGKRTRKNNATTPPSIRVFAVLQGGFSTCSLATKTKRLQKLHPRLHAVIEELVDDMLDEIEGRRP